MIKLIGESDRSNLNAKVTHTTADFIWQIHQQFKVYVASHLYVAIKSPPQYFYYSTVQY